MPPKAESSVAPNGEAGAAAGGAAAAEGAASSDDEEEEEGVAANEEEEFVPSKSKICSDLGKCSARNKWCKDTFADNMPADCVDKFSEYCCGTVVPNDLEECRSEVMEWKVLEEPINPNTESCFDQDVVNGDKNKNDSCRSCCSDKLDTDCQTETSRLGCIGKCNEKFPFDNTIATDAGSNDENSAT